jgi:cell division protein FtsB
MAPTANRAQSRWVLLYSNFYHQALNFAFLHHDLATQHIRDLDERNKELRARIVKEEAEIEHLNNQLQGRRKDSFFSDMLDVPVSSRS